ncbi:AMP-binding protein [Corynebacterium canis]|uniref:AMP-binding protein n=1 Tax=Corynebacterium canis TaxID=679663 RepID=A0A5C5UHP0_9CORY|nr:AMP-binding protein [Corynebacterium canis]TWT25556.1 AMP-binding protein [Corynebacterium canis]WJY74088.1 Polyketide synthase PksJ [Corynebacterium canis]
MEPLRYAHFLDVLLAHEGEETLGITFIDSRSEEFYPYGQLVKDAAVLASYLAELGVRRGDNVIIQIEDNKTLVQAFWAIAWLGAVPVPLGVARDARSERLLYSVFELLDSPWVLHAAELPLGHEKIGDRLVQFEDIDALRERIGELSTVAFPPVQLRGEETRVIQFSSGSTGMPKGVIVTETNLLVGLQSTVPRRPAKLQNKMLSWMPLTHNMSMIGFLVYAVFSGYPLALLPTKLFVMNPASWLYAIDRFRPTITAAPNFALKHLLTMLQARPIAANKAPDLSSLHKLVCASEPISLDLVSQFESAMAGYGLRKSIFVSGYGLSEACLTVAMSEIYEPLKAITLDRSRIAPGATVADITLEVSQGGSAFVSVGQPVPNLKVTICDESDNDLAEGVIGEVCLAGAAITDDALTAQGRQKHPTTSYGALKTGDIGTIIDGELYIIGRIKDIIFIGGKNYYGNDLEQSIEQKFPVQCVAGGYTNEVTGTESVAIFLAPSQTPVNRENAALTDAERDELSHQVRSTLMKELGIPVDRIFWVDSIPRSATGKKLRGVLMSSLIEVKN